MSGLVNVNLDSITSAVMGVVNRIWPDKTQAEKDALAAELQTQLGQIEINKVEAANTNWFVAGWRPYVGWVCGTGLLYQFLILPLLLAFGVKAQPVDLGSLIALLMAMLGMGSLRTAEKMKDVEGNR